MPDQEPPTSTDPLRIESIRTTIVNVPLEAPYQWSAGLYYGATKVIVEVRTSDGIVGLGEAPNWRHAALIEEDLAPQLIGLDARDLHRCRGRAVPPISTLRNTDVPDIVRAYGAVEMALWDVQGKAAGLPLHVLLGGAVRREVGFTEYFSGRGRLGDAGGEQTPEEIAAYCARMVEEYDSPWFEGKVGYADLETDVAIVREVRAAIGPERMLRLDANAGWRLSTAQRALARIAPYDVANIEDPVGTFEEMELLRRNSPIPFSVHVPDIRRAARTGVPDSFVLNITNLGGIEPTRRFIAACESLGIDFWFYSGDTGVGTACYLQLAAAEPWVSLPSQSLLRWYVDDVIAGGPFSPRGGTVQVPDGPGLGVELDPEAVKRCHRRFLDDGPIAQMTPNEKTGLYELPPLY